MLVCVREGAAARASRLVDVTVRCCPRLGRSRSPSRSLRRRRKPSSSRCSTCTIRTRVATSPRQSSRRSAAPPPLEQRMGRLGNEVVCCNYWRGG
eukprot:2570812-Prymnesium_polylepis.1